MSILPLLYFALPLYFSHILAPFGITFPQSFFLFLNTYFGMHLSIEKISSFERQKVYLFIFCIVIGLILVIFHKNGRFVNLIRTNIGKILMTGLIPFISLWIFHTSIDSIWLFGTNEKHHGYLLYISIILLILLLNTQGIQAKQKIIYWGTLSATFVGFFALLEYFGIFRFFSHGSSSWELGRTISTLGNPNYLAGYLLMHVPFISQMRKPERYTIFVIIIGAIITTGSYIAIILLVGYVSYLLLRKLIVRKDHAIFIVLFGFTVLGIFGSQFLGHEKILSLTSRLILIKELFTEMVQYPITFLIGFGPESIYLYFDHVRSTIISSYFPDTSVIDSSHNILIDIVFQYGIIPLVIIGQYLWKSWKKIKPIGKESFILGVCFLLLNPFVVVHILILALASILYAD